MADPSPVLDLATLIERPRIRIDGTLFEILSPDELTVLDHQRFAVEGQRLDELMARPKLEGDEEDELVGLVVTITDRIMVGVPAGIRDKLSHSHRLQVIEVFTQLPARKKLGALLEALGANPKTRRSTGAKRRRASKGSTAASPAGGSPRHRSPSCGPTS